MRRAKRNFIAISAASVALFVGQVTAAHALSVTPLESYSLIQRGLFGRAQDDLLRFPERDCGNPFVDPDRLRTAQSALDLTEIALMPELYAIRTTAGRKTNEARAPLDCFDFGDRDEGGVKPVRFAEYPGSSRAATPVAQALAQPAPSRSARSNAPRGGSSGGGGTSGGGAGGGGGSSTIPDLLTRPQSATSAVSSVPLPAGAWMLLSVLGLGALRGVFRSRRTGDEI